MQARSLALQLIGILLLPVLVVAGVTLFATGPRTYAVAAVVIGLGGFAVIFTTGERPRPAQPDYERAAQSYMNNAARAAALGIATFASLFGMSSPRLTLTVCFVGIAWSILWLPAALRKLGVETSVVIARDQVTVFDYVADERNAPQYMPTVSSVDKITDGAIGLGTQFRTTSDGFVGVDQVMTIQPPASISFSLVTGLRPNRELLTFAPDPAGTRLTHRFDTELSYTGALLGEGLLRPMMAAQMRARRYAIWGRLKQILETGSAR